MNGSSLQQLTELALRFRDERDWRQFHNFKDMALSLNLEVAELIELMQWKNGAELDAHLIANRQRVGALKSSDGKFVSIIASIHMTQPQATEAEVYAALAKMDEAAITKAVDWVWGKDIPKLTPESPAT